MPPTPPRLREAHAHIAAHGREMSLVNLSACRALDECLDRLAHAAASLQTVERAARAPGPGWLLATSARIEGWAEARWPTADELDRAAPGRPCCVMSFDHHALAANTAAMTAAGLSHGAPDPQGGVIVRDAATGRPTGLMLESAAKLVWNAAPEPTPAERRRHVEAALADLAGHGFTEIHDMLSPPWLGPLLAELEREGKLAPRIWLYPLTTDIDEAAAGAGAWATDRVRLAGAKLFADGTLNSRTAWMLGPYADPLPGMPTGKVMASPPEIEAAMRQVAGLGLGLAVHAIGDGAVRAVLDAHERVRPAALRDFPSLRIEHAEVIDEADAPRFAKLGVVASVQPCHLLYDIEVLERALPHRLSRVLPLRDLISSGCRPGELLWFGSDTPIVRPHPQDSIQAAVQRRRSDMSSSRAIAGEQRIKEDESWAAFKGAEHRL